MNSQQFPVFAALFTILSLIQVINCAVFNGIPAKPGKSKFNNNAAEYDSVSMLPGLLSPPIQRLKLDLRQQRTCPVGFPVPCPGLLYCCTPSFNKCCGDGTCCPGNANCQGSGGCCPQIAQTCGGRFCCDPGAICCGNPARGCCDPGMVCCLNGCCDVGETCCGNECCTSGSKCCEDTCCPDNSECAGNGQCRLVTTSISTSQSSSTAVRTLLSTSLSTATRTIISSSTNTRTSSTSTPTVTFIYVPGLTDAICMNICLGMRSRGKVNIDTLTYDPSNKPAKRRRAGCVTGRCNTSSTGRTCDEYPFASSEQGGANASTMCVPKEQNTDQGSYLKFWFADHGFFPGINVGKPFGVEVVGLDCNIVIMPRDTVTGSGNNSTVLPGLTLDNQTAGPSSGRLLLPLGDVNAGSYSMSLSMPGQGSSIDSLIVVDNEGELFAQVNGSISDSETVNFNLQNDGFGIGMVLFTAQKSLDVAWNYSATTNVANEVSPVQRLPQLWTIFVLVSTSFLCSIA